MIGRALVAAVAASAIAAGCGALPGQFATNDQLRGPWRTEPMAVDSATVADAEQACRGPHGGGGDMAIGGRLVLVDARGGGRLILVFEGRGGGVSECQLEMEPGGQLAVRALGGSTGVGDVPPLAANDVIVDSTSGSVGDGEVSTSVTGRIGANVSAVVIKVSDGVAVRASVGGGWFTAWWPAGANSLRVEAFDASGRKIGEAGGSVP